MQMQDPDQSPQHDIGSHRDRSMLFPYWKKPSFNCDAQERYVEVMNFEIEIMNILETRAYELVDEEKVLELKMGKSGGSSAYKDLYP